MDQNKLNKILLAILFVESILVAGMIGYRLGEAKHIEPVEPAVYNFTLQVDPSMIEYKDPSIKKVEGFVRESEKVEEPEPITVAEPSYTDEEVAYIAKTVWGEARGLPKTEQAAVVWTILNRVDDGRFGKNIIGVITAPKQFTGYKSSHPVDPEIRNLVIDVLDRWDLEKAGSTNVGRVLPKEYLYFRGDGKHNLFTKKWNSNDIWDWSLVSPYE